MYPVNLTGSLDTQFPVYEAVKTWICLDSPVKNYYGAGFVAQSPVSQSPDVSHGFIWMGRMWHPVTGARISLDLGLGYEVLAQSGQDDQTLGPRFSSPSKT